MTAVLGIYREDTCSPGRHLENDARILELVAGELEGAGITVALSKPEDAERVGRDATLVFSMSRSPRVLGMLDEWSRAGKVVVNRPDAVLATARSRLAGWKARSFDRPWERVVPTAPLARPPLVVPPEGWWVKGGDLYASRREDVRRVETMDALHRTLDDFARRHIETALLQAHVPGREVKFYMVGDGRFLHALDIATQSPISATTVFEGRAAALGAALGLEVFGGDLMIEDDGRVTLIDLNDWPSFAPCPDAGARAIAQHLCARAAAAAISPK